jgi:lysophospholipase L1-like esterase
MLGKDGQPLPDIWLKDKLHMNGKGYARWTELLTPILAK